MNGMMIKFKNQEEILNFVDTVTKYPYEMDMKRGRFTVDAKSLLGIMNLGLNSLIELKIYGEDGTEYEDLKKAISIYKVA